MVNDGRYYRRQKSKNLPLAVDLLKKQTVKADIAGGKQTRIDKKNK
jgi:hypothetical protein